MVLRILLLEFLFCITSFTLSGQRYISGCVTDSENKKPIAGVSVFIAGTTVGVATDTEGNYRLEMPGEGSYRLTVSHVGYQSVVKNIEPGNISVTLNITMSVREIEELTMSAKVQFRKRDINLFWRTVFGKQPSQKTIYAVNPESVYYYYNSETRILKVTCREPLQIINNETGYQVRLVLDRFTHDYKTNVSLWDGDCMFTELEPENLNQKSVWEENRKKIYQVSLTNFIRSLYNNTLKENGFLLTYPRKLDQTGNPRKDSYTYRNPQDFIIIDSIAGGRKTLYIPSDLNDLMLVCFSDPVDNNNLYNAEQAYHGKKQWYTIGYYRSILQTPETTVQIFPDGTYKNSLQIIPCFDSNSMMGLTAILPKEYVPDAGAMLSVSPDAPVSVENRLLNRFRQQLEVFPQEKIYLHTDKPWYISGEQIYFRAHLADAATHIPVSYSRYVYVDLVNPSDSVVTSAKIRSDEASAYHGYLLVPDDMPEGDYTIRACTDYMRSLDEDYPCFKTVRIGIPKALKANSPEPDDDFDVSFYPEGGSLMQGTSCKLVYKALNSNGKSVNITGVVYDHTGNEMQRFETEHSGMGGFRLLAEKGKNYYAVCQNDKGQSKRFDLPAAVSRGYALAVTQSNDSICVSVLKPKESTRSEDIYLLAHTRGMVHFAHFFDHDHDIVILPANEYPSGVLHFILFDAGLNPLSERLFFINNQEYQAQVTYEPDQTHYAARSLVKNKVSLTDSDGEPLTGNFSVAVTSDREVMQDSTSNILTQLLLASDLRGHIENPSFYFQNNNRSSSALDLLMCTQGWRRYNIAELAQGSFDMSSAESDYEILGYVNNVKNGRPVKDIEVNALSLIGGYFSSAKTDRNGHFSIPIGEFPDSTLFMVSVAPKKGLTQTNLILDPVVEPKIKIFPVHSSEINSDQSVKYAEKTEQKNVDDDSDISLYELSEVAITAARKPPRKSQYYSRPDNIITTEEIEKSNARNVYELISSIPGVQVSSDNRINLRGAVSWTGSTKPLIMLDNILMNPMPDSGDEVKQSSSILDMISVYDIAQIDILKSATQTAIFGSRGANGVIAIYTKKGSSNHKSSNIVTPTFHIKSIFPLGYQQPVAFYAPKYDTPEKRNAPTPDKRTTIHWQPVVQTNSEGVASFEFYASDFRTNYSVVIEGITDDGKIVRQVEKIQVE